MEVDGEVGNEGFRGLGVELVGWLVCEGWVVGDGKAYRAQAVGAGVVDEDVDGAVGHDCLRG